MLNKLIYATLQQRQTKAAPLNTSQCTRKALHGQLWINPGNSWRTSRWINDKVSSGSLQAANWASRIQSASSTGSCFNGKTRKPLTYRGARVAPIPTINTWLYLLWVTRPRQQLPVLRTGTGRVSLQLEPAPGPWAAPTFNPRNSHGSIQGKGEPAV